MANGVDQNGSVETEPIGHSIPSTIAERCGLSVPLSVFGLKAGSAVKRERLLFCCIRTVSRGYMLRLFGLSVDRRADSQAYERLENGVTKWKLGKREYAPKAGALPACATPELSPPTFRGPSSHFLQCRLAALRAGARLIGAFVKGPPHDKGRRMIAAMSCYPLLVGCCIPSLYH